MKYINYKNLLVLSLLLLISNLISNQYYGEEITETSNVCDIVVCNEISDSLTIENLYNYIQHLDVEHPDIVFAQAVLETGYFSSELCNDANNLFGMRMPRVRETMAIESYKGYAKFDTWKDSVNDYLLWQSRFAINKTRDEYFEYLGRVYAQDKSYTDKLQVIIRRHNDLA